jgi:HEAT repeat protein
VTAQEARPTVQEEQKLIALLESDAAVFAKAKACQRLAVIGTKRAAPALVALLGDERLGDYARFGLEPIADPSVDDALRSAIGRLQGRLLVGVINSIGARRDPKAVPALAKLALTGKEGAAEALAALGRIATDEAVEALRRILASGPAASRSSAAHACLAAAERLVAQSRSRDASALYDVVREADVPAYLHLAAAHQAILVRGAAGVPLLIELLKDNDGGRVDMALRAARELPGPEVTQALAAELGVLPPGVQVLVIKVLASRKDPNVSKQLEVLTASKEPAVRVEALAALGEVGEASAVAVLLNAAGAGGKEAATALSSLRAIKGDAVDAALIQALRTAKASLRAELISVLVDRGCTVATAALLEQASRRDAAVAKAAFKALGVLASPGDLPAMVRLLVAAKGAQAQAETAIVLVAERTADISKRTDSMLAALASTREPAARAALLRVLGRIGGEKAYVAVEQAIGDDNAEVKDAAIRALAAWPDARAADALLGLVKNADSEVHRILALRGYVRLLGSARGRDPKDIVRRYAEVLATTRRPDARKLILAGLADVAHVDALALVMAHLDDPAVGTEAASAAVAVARAVMGADRDAARAAMEKVLIVSKNRQLVAEAQRIIGQIDKFADSITAWRIAGRYSQKGKRYSELFDIVFEPEKPDAERVEWRSLTAGTDSTRPWILDLLKAIGGHQRVAYALTWVHSEKAQPAQLQLGSDDGVKAWLNGQLVHANNAARAAMPYTDKANVSLRKGWNPLLLKITQNDYPWEFCARICRRDGKPLAGLRIDRDHEGEWRLPEKGATPVKPTTPVPADKGKRIFDGRTFTGWEGNREWFRIEDGAIVGGDLRKPIPRNEFLCATTAYGDFQLRLKVKLVDNKGNAGIQIRSQRIPNHHEMIGYQADVSSAYWGALYDESRRRKMLARPDRKTLVKAVKSGEWNEYVIRCEGRRIQLWLNGVQTVDYTEPDPKIPQTGLIGLQIHGGPASEVWYKEIEIVELP